MFRFKNDLLRELRLECGLGQEQAAEEIGVDIRTYRSYERGEVNRGEFLVNRKDRHNILHRMAEVFEQADPQVFLEKIPGDEARRPAQSGPYVPNPPGASYQALSYVSRDREETGALSYLMTPGKPVILWGPRQCGKTWLMEHLWRRFCQAEAQPCHLARVDLREFNGECLGSYDAFLREFGAHLLEPLGASSDLLEEAWRRSTSVNLKLAHLVTRLLANDIRLFLAIDWGDTLLKREFWADFFGMLRSWAERHSPPWVQIRLIVSLSSDPTWLASGDSSPFANLSDPIEVYDMEPQQVLRLAALHQLPWTEPEVLRLMALIGGHPYLLRAAMHHAMLFGCSVDQVVDQAEVFPPFTRHLRSMKKLLTADPALSPVLSCIARSTIEQTALDDGVAERLRRTGLVIKLGRGYRLRADIYQQLCE